MGIPEELDEMAPSESELRGVVTHTYYSSATFSAGKLLRADGKEVKFAGPAYLRIGETVACRGKWVKHEKYGPQFQIASVDLDEQIDETGLAHWLTVHPAAVGIGPVRAERIAKTFGQNFDEALRERPEQIAAVAGVPVEAIRELAREWAARAGFNATATKLAAFGLTRYQIESLLEACGSTVIKALEEDPYSVLGKVPGFGFKKVDDIARNGYGIAKRDTRRIDAAILHCLRDALEDGSTCMDRPDLCTAAEKALFLDDLDAEAVVCDRIDLLAIAGRLVAIREGPGYYALPWIYQQETFVRDFLATGDNLNPSQVYVGIFPRDIERLWPTADPDQVEAITLALAQRIAVVSGGAGSGKTTTMKTVAAIYQQAGKEVALCCPTGKAARRLTEVTGVQAQTIHRLLEYSPKYNEFKRNPDNPIDADVVIVDEVSMVDITLAYHLFRAIGPQTAVLLVGDHHQLPPVGPGSLLRDCIARQLVPAKILTHCHRQAGVLKQNCSAILGGTVAMDKAPAPAGGGPGPWYVDGRHDGDNPESLLRVLETLWLAKIPEWGYDAISDVQLLSAMHRGKVGTRSLNVMLQQLHQRTLGVEVEPPEQGKAPKLYLGDKVLCTRNTYELDIFNGMQGTVKSLKPLVVTLEGRDVEIPPECSGIISLAYCLTPHKCQGSEWPCIIVVCHKEQWIMHSRNWLYTAATRARKTLVLVGDKWSIENAARRVQPDKRRTILGLGD